MERFRRRTYDGIGEVIADIRAVMSRFREIRPLMRGVTIDPAFRERLMLTVTEVNGYGRTIWGQGDREHRTCAADNPHRESVGEHPGLPPVQANLREMESG